MLSKNPSSFFIFNDCLLLFFVKGCPPNGYKNAQLLHLLLVIFILVRFMWTFYPINKQ